MQSRWQVWYWSDFCWWLIPPRVYLEAWSVFPGSSRSPFDRYCIDLVYIGLTLCFFAVIVFIILVYVFCISMDMNCIWLVCIFYISIDMSCIWLLYVFCSSMDMNCMWLVCVFCISMDMNFIWLLCVFCISMDMNCPCLLVGVSWDKLWEENVGVNASKHLPIMISSTVNNIQCYADKICICICFCTWHVFNLNLICI